MWNVNPLARFLMVCLSLSLVGAAAPARELSSDMDWARARELHQRSQRGEKLTPDDQAYLDRAKAERQKTQREGRRPGGGRPEGVAKAGGESTGLTPLTDLGADQNYKGFDGGLYGGGRNEPTEAHLKAALAEAARVVSLDGDGKPAADGKVVLLSIGMSNTTQEFSTFKAAADRDAEKSPKLVIVDGAQGGQDAADWSGDKRRQQPPPRGRGGTPWEVADKRLAAAGVTPKQVQVVWIKQARKGPASLGEFPRHAKELQGHLASILRQAKERYPNLRLAYLSSRTYAGYAQTALNPEPYAYESGFAVRWVIEEQEPGLNYDAAKGAVKAPVALWGPYLWADGVKGRKASDLAWEREDLAGDGTHPSNSGRSKVAEQLLRFFKTDRTARTWFLGKLPE